MKYVDKVLTELKEKNADQPEFIEAATNILKSLEPVIEAREFDSCLQFFTNQIAQNVDYINTFEFFYCQICENKCTNTG